MLAALLVVRCRRFHGRAVQSGLRGGDENDALPPARQFNERSRSLTNDDGGGFRLVLGLPRPLESSLGGGRACLLSDAQWNYWRKCFLILRSSDQRRP